MILLPLAAALAAQHEHFPRWYDDMLAGYEFTYDQKHSAAFVYDPKTHYMLLREPECDGGDLTLLLTRDRYEITGMGFSVPGFKKQPEFPSFPTTVKALPSLSTGKGLTIGDSEATVRRRLGKPTQTEKTGDRKQFVNFDYIYTGPPGDDGREYQETYVFKQGRLIEILFEWDPNHEPDKAVVAPAAKKAVAKPSDAQ